jgi:HAE1 family hydrophobic/amphiphilic exporter-1
MAILGLIVMGYMGYTRLQVDRMPKADIPYVTVVVVYPGASPDDVSTEVLKKVEDAVAGISGIKQITSQANENFGTVTLEFAEGTNGNQAAMDVSREVNTIKGDLPADAEEPTILKADINATPIMQIVLSGPQGQDALYALADQQLKGRIQAVSGVASVSIFGGRDSQIQVEPDPVKLAAYNLSLSNLQQILAYENVTAPAGSVDQGDQKNAIRSVGEFTGLTDIEDVIVAGRPSQLEMMLPASMLPKVPAGMDTGGLVYLRDVAAVTEGFADTTRLVRYNGQPAVLITVVKTSDANAIEVADAVAEELNIFTTTKLPGNAKLDVVVDNTEFTRASVEAVQEDLFLAVLITGVIMLLFLHTINSSLIVMLSVPTSLIITFLAMWLFGFSLNTLTLIALTLVIAIVVDDSIVVLENIERHLKMGKTPVQAALDGRGEIGMAAITITFVIVVVYLPVSFMSGIVGQFFLQYGITVAVATLLSLLVSFTLTPMLAAFWLKDHQAAAPPRQGLGKLFYLVTWPIAWVWQRFISLWEGMFTGLANLYAWVLRLALKNVFTQLMVVAIAAVALYAGLYLVTGGLIASEMTPQEDDGQINIGIELPAGTNLDATNRAALRAEQIIVREVPELAKLVTNVGSTMGTAVSSGSNQADSAVLTIKLVDKTHRQRSSREILEALRVAMQDIPAANVALELNTATGGSDSTEFRLLGPDQDVLIDLAKQAEQVLRTTPGVVDIRNNGANRTPETRLVVNRRRATDLGLYPGQVALELRTAINGTEVGTIKPAEAGLDDISIVLRTPKAVRENMPQVLQLPLGYFNGERISVGQVTAIEEAKSPGSIQRLNRQPSMLVRYNVSGRGSADVANEVEAALNAQIDFPAGYQVKFTGMTDIQRDAFTQLATAMGLSVLLIYMLLVALYQSWLQPLSIMFALPVTLVGAFGGLLLTGNSINIMSLLGVIMLIGIVAKNAILLVDYTNILRTEHGFEIKHALVEAGRARLRPILMTVFAIVFALLPLLFGTAAGSEMRAPMAAVLIGGNISSTLLTLVLVPVMYYFFEWLGQTFGSLYRRVMGSDTPQEESTIHQGPQGPASAPQPGA